MLLTPLDSLGRLFPIVLLRFKSVTTLSLNPWNKTGNMTR